MSGTKERRGGEVEGFLFREPLDEFGGQVEEEDGEDEDDGEHHYDEGITEHPKFQEGMLISVPYSWQVVMSESRKGAYTWSPGESSVYSLSMVPLEPLAPAARAELGFWTAVPVARRLVTCAYEAAEVDSPD